MYDKTLRILLLEISKEFWKEVITEIEAIGSTGLRENSSDDLWFKLAQRILENNKRKATEKTIQALAIPLSSIFHRERRCMRLDWFNIHDLDNSQYYFPIILRSERSMLDAFLEKHKAPTTERVEAFKKALFNKKKLGPQEKAECLRAFRSD